MNPRGVVPERPVVPRAREGVRVPDGTRGGAGTRGTAGRKVKVECVRSLGSQTGEGERVGQEEPRGET